MGFRITPDYFIFQPENVKIQYMRENLTRAYQYLPLAYFGEQPFTKVYYEDGLIKVGIEEWIPFYLRLYKLLLGDGETVTLFKDMMEKHLGLYSSVVDRLTANYLRFNELDGNLLKEAFELYSIVHGYAFFNLFMPTETVSNIIRKSDILSSIDDIAYSLVESHRVQYRRKELELACIAKEQGIEAVNIDEYKNGLYIYTMEYEWNFYSRFMDSKQLITKRIDRLSKKLTLDDIKNELHVMNTKRSKSMSKLFLLLSNLWDNKDKSEIDKQIYYIAVLLINIVTQEEIRHMTTSRFMYLLGKIAYEKDIDIATTETEKLIRYLSLPIGGNDKTMI